MAGGDAYGAGSQAFQIDRRGSHRVLWITLPDAGSSTPTPGTALVISSPLSAEVIASIGHPSETRQFSLSEAKQVLPILRKVTTAASGELAPYQDQMTTLLDCDPRQRPMKHEFEQIVRKWISQVQRLGLRVSGLWEVGFDTGDGYLCWRHPELRLAYFRYYEEDFSRRRPIAQVIEEDQPEWAHQ